MLTSDWYYNGQFVPGGRNSTLFEPQGPASLQERIECVLYSLERVGEYERHSCENADNYTIEPVTGELTTYLERSGW